MPWPREMRERVDLYQEVFGLPVAHEDEDSAMFGFANTMIILLKVSAARELIASPGGHSCR